VASDQHEEQRRLAEEHYGEPVVRLERGGLVAWFPQSLVEKVRADRARRDEEGPRGE
jgi:hypothetical protein